MSKIKKIEMTELEKRGFFNDKLICIDTRKIYVEGNGIIKINDDYLTIDDKLIIDVETESQDIEYINTIDKIQNINGIHQVKNQYLNKFLDNFNNNFISLDNSIEEMTPLLEMLEEGEYYINYVKIFPTTTENKFFWDLSSDSKVHNSIDYGYLIPIYIRAAEGYDFYNKDRVNYYLERYEKTKERPTPIIINLSGRDYENIVLDGHHKIVASYLKNEPIKAIMIMNCKKNIKHSLTPIPQRKGILNIKLINDYSSQLSKFFYETEYKIKKNYKSKLNKSKNIEYENIFNDKIYKTKYKYPDIRTLMKIYYIRPNNFSKDEEGLNIKERCHKLLELFLTNRSKSKEYALKIAKRTEIDVDVYLAITILFNFNDEDVIFFFSDYYSNYCEFDESTNYIYKMSALYLNIEE